MKLKKILLGILLGLSLLFTGCNFVEAGTYKVTFYDGKDIISSAYYKKGDTIVLPDAPIHDDEYFIGWDKNNDGIADEITTCTNNMNLRAVFGDAEKFIVIFKDGANELSKRTYAKGQMPAIPDNPTREGYIFVGWDANGDDEVDQVKEVSSDITYVAIFRDDNRTYSVEFFVGDNKIDTKEYHLNDVISAPATTPTKTKTDEFSYTFVGWDVNGDGIVEIFPFTVKGNHKFVAVFNETVNRYTYKLYDGNSLIDTKTVNYGEKVAYNGSLYKKIDGKWNYLIGWDKNDDGNPDNETITGDTTFKAIYTNTQILVMHYEDEEIVEYITPGSIVTLYEPTLPSSRACVWYTDNTYETPYSGGVMVIGNLDLYGRSELTYAIDCSILEYTPKGTVESEDELVLLFDSLVFQRIYNYTVKVNYDNPNEEFATFLSERCSIDYAYQVGTSYNNTNKELKITLQYKNVNCESSKSLYESNSIPYYVQFDSLNSRNNLVPRSEEFALFIDSVEKTFEVSDSEQLYYVLEHGYRPIIKSGNTDLANLYNKMRNVLKESINDSMSDYEKVLKIYEWLVMNVVYDRVALQLSNDPNVTNLHSFYLEGVFDDNLAVCDGISKALVCLCNMEGIPAIRVTGTGSQNHAWNKVCVNGKWYVVDATSGGTIINSTYEVLTHRFFLITDDDFARLYQEDGKYYTDFVANGEYDYYDNFTYNYEDNDYKFKCTSQDDLVRVLKWLKTFDRTNFTVDVRLDFEYSSISSLMSSAMGEARYTTGVTYTLDGDILLLIEKNS